MQNLNSSSQDWRADTIKCNVMVEYYVRDKKLPK